MLTLPVICIESILRLEVPLCGLLPLPVRIHLGPVELANYHVRCLARYLRYFWRRGRLRRYLTV